VLADWRRILATANGAAFDPFEATAKSLRGLCYQIRIRYTLSDGCTQRHAETLEISFDVSLLLFERSLAVAQALAAIPGRIVVVTIYAAPL